MADPWKHIELEARKPHISTKLIADIVGYLEEHHPEMDIDEICHKAGVTREYIEAEDQWLSIIAFDQLLSNIPVIRKNLETCVDIGCNSFKNLSKSKTLYLLGHQMPLYSFYALLPKIVRIFNRVIQIETLANGWGFLYLRITPDYYREALSFEERASLRNIMPLIAYNAAGYCSYVPLLHSLPPAEYELSQSQDQDGEPVYDLKLHYLSLSKSKRLLYAIYGLGALFSALCFSLWGLLPGLVSLVVFLSLGLFYATTKLFDYDKRLESQHDYTVQSLQNADERYHALHKAYVENQDLLDSYKKFVPFPYLESLKITDFSDISLNQYTSQEASLLFCDIRGFSRLAEELPPSKTFELLNEHYGVVVSIIEKHGGFVDKYIGDEVMAIFPPNGHQAISAAQEIDEEVKKQNQKRIDRQDTPIEVGMGVATGEVMIGTVGAESHMQVTVVSDAVNTASRLQNLTKDFQCSLIVCSESLRRAQKEKAFFQRRLGNIALRGKNQSLSSFEIITEPKSALSQKKLYFKETSDSAISLWEQGEEKKALEIFKQLQAQNSHDPLVAYYLSSNSSSSGSKVLPFSKERK